MVVHDLFAAVADCSKPNPNLHTVPAMLSGIYALPGKINMMIHRTSESSGILLYKLDRISVDPKNRINLYCSDAVNVGYAFTDAVHTTITIIRFILQW